MRLLQQHHSTFITQVMSAVPPPKSREERLDNIKKLYQSLLDPFSKTTTAQVAPQLRILANCEDAGLVPCDPSKGECPADVENEEWGRTWAPHPEEPERMMKCVPREKKIQTQRDMTPDEEVQFLMQKINARIADMDKLMRWQNGAIKQITDLRMRGECEAMTFKSGDKVMKRGEFRKLKKQYERNPVDKSGRVLAVKDGQVNGLVKEPFVDPIDDVNPHATDIGVCTDSLEFTEHQVTNAAIKRYELQTKVSVLKNLLSRPDFQRFSRDPDMMRVKVFSKSPELRESWNKYKQMTADLAEAKRELNNLIASERPNQAALLTEAMIRESAKRSDEKCMILGTETFGKCVNVPGCLVVDHDDGAIHPDEARKTRNRNMTNATCLSSQGMNKTWRHGGRGKVLEFLGLNDGEAQEFDIKMTTWVEAQLRLQPFNDDQINYLAAQQVLGINFAMDALAAMREKDAVKDDDKIAEAGVKIKFDQAKQNFLNVTRRLRKTGALNVLVDLRAICARYFDAMAGKHTTQIKQDLICIAPTRDFEEEIASKEEERRMNPKIGDIVTLTLNGGAEHTAVRMRNEFGDARDFNLIHETAFTLLAPLSGSDFISIQNSFQPRQPGDIQLSPNMDKIKQLRGKFNLPVKDNASFDDFIYEYIESRVMYAARMTNSITGDDGRTPIRIGDVVRVKHEPLVDTVYPAETGKTEETPVSGGAHDGVRDSAHSDASSEYSDSDDSDLSELTIA